MYGIVHRRSACALIGTCLLLAIAHASPAAAQSVDIYPWQNIQQVVNGYPAGTTFILKSGVHRMQTITARSGDRYIGESGTIVSGARQLTEFGRAGAYWFADGQWQEGPRPYAWCRDGAPRCAFPENFYIDGVPLRHVDHLGAVTPGTFFFDYGADRIYFADDPTFRTVEASVTAKAFDGYSTDVYIANLVFEKYATPVGEAAVPLGTRTTMERSEVRLNHYAGVGTGFGSVLRSTYVHHNGGFGIVGAGDGTLVESNEIAYNNFAGFYPYWGAGGSKWVHTNGLVVRGNYSHHNGGPGLWTDIGNIYTLYENNTVEDNERGGIFHELSYDATIRNNTARRNGSNKPVPYWTTGAGIEIIDSRNVEIYGNLVEDNWQGITALEDHRGVGPYGPYAVTNLYVHDNMIISRITDPGGGRTGIIDMDLVTAFAYGNNRFQNNQYVLGNPNGQYFMWYGDKTLSQWQSFGHDTVSAVVGGVGAALTGGGGGGGALLASVSGDRTRVLSDESWVWMVNGWGQAERNRSNGETGASDGRTLSIRGAQYQKGLGVHAYSDLRWNLSGQCSAFSAVIGIDDETGSRGTANFLVLVDGAVRYESGAIGGWMPGQSVWVDISGGSELALIVTDAGDGGAFDHADWADAKVMCSN